MAESALSGHKNIDRLRPSFDPIRETIGETAEIAETTDRLVRHLFDVGLRLHTVRAALERADADPADQRTTRESIDTILSDLDLLVRDAGLTMLAFARHTIRTNGHTTSSRRR
ncbi:hypothetical protein [Nocardia transvalensis]|uniref:hypothetical protein n=1 Tax=Nocardia transvalensis TaxID=37333 RepID=UPI0018930013|nr:hypothetical protein [Nocardia transvalensis]MBF6328001.1 hypothetical protein [Nocardia transvalensis]